MQQSLEPVPSSSNSRSSGILLLRCSLSLSLLRPLFRIRSRRSCGPWDNPQRPAKVKVTVLLNKGENDNGIQ